MKSWTDPESLFPRVTPGTNENMLSTKISTVKKISTKNINHIIQ